MRLLVFFISLCIICLPKGAVSQEIKSKNVNLIALDYYEDEFFKISYSDLNKLNFKEISQGSINFGFKSTRCFIRGIFQNKGSNDFSGIVTIDNPTIDKANFILKNKFLQSGDSLPFSNRPLSSKKIAFNFVLMPNQLDTFYIELTNSGEQFHIPITISDEATFNEAESKEQLIFGVYFGFLLFVLIFNVFYFFVIKDKTSIFYIGYIAALFILQLSLTGYAQKYLWPNSVYLANHINPVFASISIFFLTQFVLNFLEVEKFYPQLKKIIQIISYVLIINSILGAISEIHVFQISVLVVNGISFILVLIIIPLAILIWKNKFKPARIFFFAFVFLLISVAVFVLKNAAILPSNTLTNYGLQMGSAIEVLLLTLAMIDKFNQFKTDAFKRLEEINTLKTEANLVLEKKVLERTKTINEQKEEILSSIRYAKRIQKNILPEKKLIHKLFEENAFVLYQPKDIVSGDFYWIEEIYLGDVKTQIVVVADCTGHGVPGGFMSMLGATLVRQEIKNLLPGDGPHQLLQKISNALQISIQNYENQEDWAITDGMDMAVVFIQEPNIKFAGAKSDLLIMFKNGEFQRVKGDKNSIAHEQANEFTLHSLTLSKGDSIYLFTDGIIDQFGGSENKKLSRSGLCKLISNTNDNNFNQRENELLSKWNEWKEYNEQTDDMCLFAYKY